MMSHHKAFEGRVTHRMPRAGGAWVRGPGAWMAVFGLLALSVSAGAVAAPTTDAVKVYEWREANGVVSYSQTPPPAGTPGVSSLEVDTRHFTPAQAAAIKSYLAGLDAKQNAESQHFRQQVDAADQAVATALRNLTSAEAAFSQGRAPLPGERVGNVGGGSRLRPEYFARQKALEGAVEHARESLAAAYRQRNQVLP